MRSRLPCIRSDGSSNSRTFLQERPTPARLVVCGVAPSLHILLTDPSVSSKLYCHLVSWPLSARSATVGLPAQTTLIFFFPRLPYGQYGPVSQLSRSDESCTGPFNWGEAHCAGEKVKRKIGPFLWKSLKNQTRTRTQQKGRSPPRQPGTPWPGSQVHGPTKKQTPQARDFTSKS